MQFNYPHHSELRLSIAAKNAVYRVICIFFWRVGRSGADSVIFFFIWRNLSNFLNKRAVADQRTARAGKRKRTQTGRTTRATRQWVTVTLKRVLLKDIFWGSFSVVTCSFGSSFGQIERNRSDSSQRARRARTGRARRQIGGRRSREVNSEAWRARCFEKRYTKEFLFVLQ